MTALRARVGALSVVAGLVATLLVGPAGAQAGGRRVTVEPAVGLENQVVQVRWEGFTPTGDGPAPLVGVVQCRGAEPRSLDDCNQVQRPPGEYQVDGTAVQDGVTAADGTGSVLLEVRPATELPDLGCSSKSPCSVVAYEIDGTVPEPGQLPATAVSARLDFAASSADCPPAETPDVVTGGEASAAHALYAWSASVCTGREPLALDYSESSSPEGRANFLSGVVDVGITSMPATAAELKGSEQAFTYAPIDVSGVVVAFSAIDTATGQRITEMHLTARLVAILLAGFPGPGEALFSDPEFVALNPGHTWPTTTFQPLLRAERNADAHLLTRWLDADPAARRFLDGDDPVAPVDAYWLDIDYPTDVFESRNPNYIGTYGPLTGTLPNARRLFIGQGSSEDQKPRADVGVVGVLDAVTARKFGLPVASLRPAGAPEGAPTVAPDAAGLTAGYEAMATDPGSPTRSAVVTEAGAYPLVKVDYAMVPTKGVSPEKAGDIARFLAYARDAGQGEGQLASGYLPLPAALRTETAAAAEAVVGGAAVPTKPPAAPSKPPAAPSKPPAGPVSPPAPGGPSPGPAIAPGAAPESFGGSPSSGGDAGGFGFGSGSGAGGGAGGGAGSGGFGPSSGFDGGAAPDSGAQALPTAPGSVTPPGAAPVPGTAPGAAPVVGKTQSARVAAGGRALAIGRFAGGNGQLVLPAILGAGIAALALGPALTLLGRGRRLARSRRTVRRVAFRPRARPAARGAA